MTQLDDREIARCAKLMTEHKHAVFVFGSNLAGIHGAGAALTAVKRYGARARVGDGLAGRSYAIPTKRTPFESLGIGAVIAHIIRFLHFARERPDMLFVVTRIGCGLAGFTDDEIAPAFQGAPDNCLLPEGWRVE